MKRFAILSLLLASACAGTPAVQVRTIEIAKPVPVTCVKRADIPVEPAPFGAAPPDARLAADLLAAKVLELRGWGHKQAALLSGCVAD